MDTPISWIKAYVPDLDCTPQEYADKRIRINTVRPGMVKTAMYQGFLDSLGEHGNELLLNKQFRSVSKI